MRRNKLYITALMLLVCGFITVMLPSCTKKSNNTAVTNSTQTTENGQQPGGPDMGNMKEQIQQGIDDLVSAGTITKKQGKKIVSALTSQTNNGQRPSRPSSNSKKPSGSKPSGNSPKNSALSKLVKDKVITQKQADAVQKKIFSSFKGGQGAPSQDQNSNSDQQS